MDDKSMTQEYFRRIDKISGDIKAVDRRMTEFQQTVSETNSRFGGRIGALEAHNDVQDEQLRQIKETYMEVKRDIIGFQKEQKDTIAELRKEHKESMAELVKSNKEILAAVTPLQHKVQEVDRLSEEVDEIMAKPGKTWEEIKSKALGWVVAAVLAIVGAALGLSKFL